MTTIPLGLQSFRRGYGDLAEIQLVNRFAERSPSNPTEGVSLLARPGTKFFQNFGSGIITKFDWEPGAFSGDLFVVSGTELFRYDGMTTTQITGAIATGTNPEIAFSVGPGFEHLFIADGQSIQAYTGEGHAKGTLTASGAIVDTDTIEIDGVYYQWTSGSVDAGTPAGTLANPWLVDLGASNTEALANMLAALNASGTGGTTYTTNLSAHTTVEGLSSDATTLIVQAKVSGTGGNSITTTETGANIAWAGGTLSGGGTHTLVGVPTPDDVGIVSLTSLKNFVVAVVVNSQKFFWILPGDLTIDPLNFASAESLPDEIISARTVGDQIWLLGQKSTEAWIVTSDGDVDLFEPVEGLAFSRGIVGGTMVIVGDRVLVVGNDLITYAISASPERVSTHGIEERTRVAREQERLNG